MKPLLCVISLSTAMLASSLCQAQSANIIRTFAPILGSDRKVVAPVGETPKPVESPSSVNPTPVEQPTEPAKEAPEEEKLLLELKQASLPSLIPGKSYSFDFSTLAQWTGLDASKSPPALTFSSSSTLPSGLSLSPQGLLTGTPSGAGSTTVEVIATYDKGQARQTYTFDVALYASCKDLKNANPSSASGVYSLAMSGKSIKAYCDMTTSGGGWTMVAAMYEDDVLQVWNEGIQPDYDPSLATHHSFTLNSSEIPSHTQTAFGKNLDPTFVDFSDFVYTTGDIPVQRLKGLKSGGLFDIHRNLKNYYASHDPGTALGTDLVWTNTLTYDYASGKYAWAFSPRNTSTSRGYAMGGQYLPGTSQDYAWTVWVR